MEREDEYVELVLNNAGEDYTVCVPLDVANILLNDADEARKFLVEAGAMTPCASTTEPTCDTIAVPQCSNATPNFPASKSKFVWSSKKPTDIDSQATKYFLELRKKYADKFDDRKTIKLQLWALIAEKMNEKGYYVGEKKEASEKCRMKFANLQRTYLSYIKHVNTTGVEKKDPPPYYEEMHEILGSKHKTNPENLQDSLDSTLSTAKEADTESSSEDNTSSRHLLQNNSENTDEVRSKKQLIENRFKKNRITPKSNTEKIIDIIKQQHSDNMVERKEQFKVLENLISAQNQQRERLIDQFSKLIEIEQKKIPSTSGLKRKSSFSDDEDIT